MNNERYLFRGKRIDGLSKDFMYGSLIYCPSPRESMFIEWYIDNAKYMCEVIPKTVGQFTGLTDKNGVKVFEGDKLHSGDEEDSREYYLVVFNTKQARFQLDFYGFGMYHNEGGGEEFHNSISLIDENSIDMYCVSEFEVIHNNNDKAVNP